MYPLLLLAVLAVQHSNSRAYAPGALATPSAWSVLRALLSVLVGRPRGATLTPPAILKVRYKGISIHMG